MSMCVAMVSCIEDGFTTSPSDGPTFSVDTLKMGVVFTEDGTPTSRLTVYNRAPKSINLSNISLTGAGAQYFRINVDGQSGHDFRDIEIRGKDSIYVLVEATLPQNATSAVTAVYAGLDFECNGRTSSVLLEALGQNVTRMRGVTLTADTRLTAEQPYQIFDSLVVAPGVTLTLDAGTTLCFHDKADLIVRGRLVSDGTADAEVTLAGDRTGDVITNVSFDIMSRQWGGVYFTPSSTGNDLKHTCIRNTTTGVTVAADDSEGARAASLDAPNLSLWNCRLRNSGDYTLYSHHAAIRAVGCEFAEAANGALYLQGGEYEMSHCTMANYYLFSALGGPILQLAHTGFKDKDVVEGCTLPRMKARFDNCIIYGNGTDISHGDLTGTDVLVRNCLLKSEGSDDDNFVGCLWGKDPLFHTVREDYVFDYRLKEKSPAIGAANPSLTPANYTSDILGSPLNGPADIGEYVYTAGE